jgi:hypothetical protein
MKVIGPMIEQTDYCIWPHAGHKKKICWEKKNSSSQISFFLIGHIISMLNMFFVFVFLIGHIISMLNKSLKFRYTASEVVWW